MDILNEVVTGRARQTRHLKSHHLQGWGRTIDLRVCSAARPHGGSTDVSENLRAYSPNHQESRRCQSARFLRPAMVGISVKNCRSPVPYHHCRRGYGMRGSLEAYRGCSRTACHQQQQIYTLYLISEGFRRYKSVKSSECVNIRNSHCLSP
jgi:hypothetical protein